MRNQRERPYCFTGPFDVDGESRVVDQGLSQSRVKSDWGLSQLYNKLTSTAKPAWNIPFPVPVFTAPAIMFLQFLRGHAPNQSTELS